MTQYTTGTVTVTKNSTTVTGSGTLWSANISVSDIFITTANDHTSPYVVGSVDSDTQITLTGNYLGETASAEPYVLHRDFTSPENIPLLNQNDLQTAAIFTRAMNVIQSLISTGTDLDYGSVADATTKTTDYGGIA